MAKINCWEFKKCGREPGGKNIKDLGICPASTCKEADGFCGGINGGRACVYITGTFCNGFKQGTFKDKKHLCKNCEFYEQLRQEELGDFFSMKFFKYVKKE
ncbi:MAG: hypothetical protein GY756_03070 [bacterium]|nr:hypothetical protein [bacterium]